MEGIKCPGCSRNVVPRLHHYRPFLGSYRYVKTQHLCPFCGVAMYETGGGVTTRSKVMFWAFLTIALLSYVLPMISHN